jgi:hypothetical protein
MRKNAMEGYVVVATFANPIEADLARASLAAAGIESFLKMEDVGGMLPSLRDSRGIRVLVVAHQADEARTILSDKAETQE